MDIRTQTLSALEYIRSGCAKGGRHILKVIIKHQVKIGKWGLCGVKVTINILLFFANPSKASVEILKEIRNFFHD